MSRGPDVHTLLLRALAAGGSAVEVTKSDWLRWASATFSGARHTFTLSAPASDAFAAWLAALPEHDFALRGHLVADLTVTGTHYAGDMAVASLEVLTLEDR